MHAMKRCVEFAKKETVLCAAVLLALVSSCLVLPDREYFGYIDYRTLAILFGLMAVMAGLQQIGVFRFVAERLLQNVKSVGQLILILVMLCFFFSMVITNDVALITFVPFTFTVLHLLEEGQAKRLAVPVVVMQTIAANLGSMLTPIGNPQNLYLYGRSGLGTGSFLWLMLPFSAVSLALLAIGCFCLGRAGGKGKLTVAFERTTDIGGHKGKLAAYLLLFAVCLLAVARLLPYGVMLGIVAAGILLVDRSVLEKVDYSLLLTFVGFFVFIGNMGRIESFRHFLEGVISGNEVLTAVISSQVISNVPAALLLSGFSENVPALIIGTNLGGLGTLIASMASLISFKYVGKEDKSLRGRYLGCFTAANAVFLAVLLGLYYMTR